MAHPTGRAGKSLRFWRLRFWQIRFWRLSGIGLSTAVLAIALSSLCPSFALTDSVGPDGIDARRLQAEPYNLTGPQNLNRPGRNWPPCGQFGIDKVTPVTLPVHVDRTFELNGPAIADQSVDGHAGQCR